MHIQGFETQIRVLQKKWKKLICNQEGKKICEKHHKTEYETTLPHEESDSLTITVFLCMYHLSKVYF